MARSRRTLAGTNMAMKIKSQPAIRAEVRVTQSAQTITCLLLATIMLSNSAIAWNELISVGSQRELTTLLCASSSCEEVEQPQIFRRKTPDGIQYGVWGKPTDEPAPTIFILAGTIKDTLEQPYYRQCGNELAKLGYVVVSADLPCHGDQMREGEPAGLSGWSHRIRNGEDIVTESNTRLSSVLDDLISTGVTDPERVAAAGTSRGGFLAIHFAAHDRRVRAAAGFAPVTDLAALREFRTSGKHPFVQKLSLKNQAEKLAGRPVWLVIGDRDERVGTQHAIDLASRLSDVANARDIASNVELHVLSEPHGHTTPAGSASLAAAWVHRQLGAGNAD